MEHPSMDILMFFDKRQAALPIYEAFHKEVLRLFPDTGVRVQKTQITFFNRRVFACVSFARVKRRAELPGAYLVITLGLPAPIESRRAVVVTEPYPGRWTNHIVVGGVNELDAELFHWVAEAYRFAYDR